MKQPNRVHIVFRYDGFDFAGVEGVYSNLESAEAERDVFNSTSIMDTFFIKSFKIKDME
jgi:hypothetical protein